MKSQKRQAALAQDCLATYTAIYSFIEVEGIFKVVVLQTGLRRLEHQARGFYLLLCFCVCVCMYVQGMEISLSLDAKRQQRLAVTR